MSSSAQATPNDRADAKVWGHDDLCGQVVHDLFLEDLALAHVISLEQSKTVIKRNRIVDEAEEEPSKQG